MEKKKKRISIMYVWELGEPDYWPLKLKVKNCVCGGGEAPKNARLQRHSQPVAGSSAHGSHFACKAVVAATT